MLMMEKFIIKSIRYKKLHNDQQHLKGEAMKDIYTGVENSDRKNHLAH